MKLFLSKPIHFSVKKRNLIIESWHVQYPTFIRQVTFSNKIFCVLFINLWSLMM